MDTRMRYMAMARENEKIINQGFYEAGGEVFHFASPLSRLEEAEIYGLKALEEMVSSLSAPLGEGRISVVEGDTLAYGAEGVLNFANAFTPGGGYLYGASSQEEALCRESTLYASLSGKKGLPYYEENRRRQSMYGLLRHGLFSFRRNLPKRRRYSFRAAPPNRCHHGAGHRPSGTGRRNG